MVLIVIGALLIVSGIVMAAIRTASRGKLSAPHGGPKGTLEPRGKGDRLSVKSDFTGIGMMVVGGVLIFAGAAF